MHSHNTEMSNLVYANQQAVEKRFDKSNKDTKDQMKALCTRADLKKVADRIGRLVSQDELDEHRQEIAPMATQCKKQILTHEFEHK